ncbi:MAG TPA: hypothetical protein VK841_24805 [Polyangiaceae bacterium]|jgi:hypothetical protein|nr:hypothetical protein [Polyangiaceae bacterium]
MGDNLDIFISFATVMLGISMLIMILTQTVSTAVNLRGKKLAKALEALLAEAKVDVPTAASVAHSVLTHRLVSDGVIVPRLAPAIRKDELLRILEKLKTTMTAAEAAQFKDSNDTIEKWFDSAMDRAAHEFAGILRLVTVGFSLIVAFGMHLDTLELLSQLSSTTEMRAGLVASSASMMRHAESLQPKSAGTTTEDSESVDSLVKEAKGIRSDLTKAQLRLLPEPYPGLSYAIVNNGWRHLLGVLVSAVLLSLGAPFWFNMLRTASTLRPLLAAKADDETSPPAAT